MLFRSPQMQPGPARDFVMALFQSHYAVVIFAVQLIAGILLLVNRYVPLALTFLGAVIVNIDCYQVHGSRGVAASRVCDHPLVRAFLLPPAIVCGNIGAPADLIAQQKTS